MDDVNTGTWHRWLGLCLPATVRFLDEPPSCLLQTNALLITLWNSSQGADPGGKEPLRTTPAVRHWGGIPGAGTVLPLPSLLLTPPGAARKGAVPRHKRAQPRKPLGKARISPQIYKNGAHGRVKRSLELSLPDVQGQGPGLAVPLCPSPAPSPSHRAAASHVINHRTAHAGSRLESHLVQPFVEKGSKRGISVPSEIKYTRWWVRQMAILSTGTLQGWCTQRKEEQPTQATFRTYNPNTDCLPKQTFPDYQTNFHQLPFQTNCPD